MAKCFLTIWENNINIQGGWGGNDAQNVRKTREKTQHFVSPLNSICKLYFEYKKGKPHNTM